MRATRPVSGVSLTELTSGELGTVSVPVVLLCVRARLRGCMWVRLITCLRVSGCGLEYCLKALTTVFSVLRCLRLLAK